MWYKTTITIFLYLLSLSLTHFQPVEDTVKGHSTKKEDVHNLVCAQPAFIAIAQNDQTSTSESKQSDRSVEDKKSKTEQKSTSPKKRKKSAPLKDFVPSEKIEADKAVDFPVDI